MALITVAQYEARAATSYAGDELTKVTALIDDASALVNLIAFGTTTADYWDDTTVPDAVVPVVVSMVRRALENPRGLSGEQLGDYQWQAGQSTSQTIYATRPERRIIRRAAGTLGVGSATLEGYLTTRSVLSEFEEDWLESF